MFLTSCKVKVPFLFGLFLLLALNLLLSACGEQNKIVEVGIYLDSPSQAARFDGLKEGLKTLGFIEGKNIRFQQLNGNGQTINEADLKTRLADFVNQKYATYWTTNGTAAEALKQVGLTQPLIVAGFSDPVARKLVQSLDLPGTNMTGIDSINVDLTLKRLNWLYKLKIKSSYLLYDPTSGSQKAVLDNVRSEAARLQIKLVEKTVTTKEDARKLLAELNRNEAQAVLTVGIAPLSQTIDGKDLRAAIEREKLVLIGGDRSHLEIGALLTYGGNYYAMGRQSALYVSKVIQGANPAEIPIQQPNKIELILNQKLANQFGFQFPEVMLDAADELV